MNDDQRGRQQAEQERDHFWLSQDLEQAVRRIWFMHAMPRLHEKEFRLICRELDLDFDEVTK